MYCYKGVKQKANCESFVVFYVCFGDYFSRGA